MDFVGFRKIARLSRMMVVTEKIDGTNAQIYISENGEFFTGSRTRWITPENDNYGFSKWAHDHKKELMGLGPGSHFGEWWGNGIQRGYGLPKGEKRFSLFNVSMWEESRPECCHVVPVIWRGIFDTQMIVSSLEALKVFGSLAASGFMRPEGVIVYHTAGNLMFKKTIEKDELPKGVATF